MKERKNERKKKERKKQRIIVEMERTQKNTTDKKKDRRGKKKKKKSKVNDLIQTENQEKKNSQPLLSLDNFASNSRRSYSISLSARYKK